MSAKIFIIEDESDLVKALVIRLKAEGFQTACVTDGISALERAREEKPDLILLDICLPGRNGFEVFQQLRQDPATERIPIVFSHGTLNHGKSPKGPAPGRRRLCHQTISIGPT